MMPPSAAKARNQGFLTTVGSISFQVLAMASTRPQAMKAGMIGMKMLPMWRNTACTDVVW